MDSDLDTIRWHLAELRTGEGKAEISSAFEGLDDRLTRMEQRLDGLRGRAAETPTECAACGWNTPCYNDGEAYICCDHAMCRQNQHINEMKHERDRAIEQLVALLAALEQLRSETVIWIDDPGLQAAIEIADQLIAKMRGAETEDSRSEPS